MTDQQTAALELLRQTRLNTLGLFQAYSSERLNKVPDGFRNNLMWNAGHVIATMELLVYGLSGVKTPSGREFIDRYRKGTAPDGPASVEDEAYIGKMLLGGIDQLSEDLERMDLNQFKEYQTSYGVKLTNVAEALQFNNMHEAMHLGTMLAMRKLV